MQYQRKQSLLVRIVFLFLLLVGVFLYRAYLRERKAAAFYKERNTYKLSSDAAPEADYCYITIPADFGKEEKEREKKGKRKITLEQILFSLEQLAKKKELKGICLALEGDEHPKDPGPNYHKLEAFVSLAEALDQYKKHGKEVRVFTPYVTTPYTLLVAAVATDISLEIGRKIVSDRFIWDFPSEEPVLPPTDQENDYKIRPTQDLEKGELRMTIGYYKNNHSSNESRLIDYRWKVIYQGALARYISNHANSSQRRAWSVLSRWFTSGKDSLKSLIKRSSELLEDKLERVSSKEEWLSSFGDRIIRVEDYPAEEISQEEKGIDVLFLQGTITDKGQEQLINQLQGIAHADSVSAVLLVIESSGGYKGIMEKIIANIEEIKKQKKVIAYIRRECTSAAYVIAASCDYVIANRATVIGSIGVVHTIPIDDIEEDKVREELRADYNHLLALISTYRGIPIATIRATQGRVYPAALAIEQNLVDQLGNLKDVIAYLNKEVGVMPFFFHS